MSHCGSLEEYKIKWDAWSYTADKGEDGWEALFPYGLNLIEAAKQLMMKSKLSEDDFKNIEFCWLISEEDEPLADFAKENVKQCWPVVERMCESIHPKVRWQAYAVLPLTGAAGESKFQTALQDQDDYCRRRAFLGFVEAKKKNSLSVAKKFLEDRNSYLREIAKQVVEELSQSKPL